MADQSHKNLFPYSSPCPCLGVRIGDRSHHGPFLLYILRWVGHRAPIILGPRFTGNKKKLHFKQFTLHQDRERNLLAPICAILGQPDAIVSGGIISVYAFSLTVWSFHSTTDSTLPMTFLVDRQTCADESFQAPIRGSSWPPSFSLLFSLISILPPPKSDT